MEKLLEQFSATQIAIFIAILAGAVKGVFDFVAWIKGLLDRLVKKHDEEQAKENEVKESLEKESKRIDSLEQNQKEILDLLTKIDSNISTLKSSDMDTLKATLTREHHYFCYQLGWIDDYSLSCCEKLYEHYKAEGGNSFIGNFMDEMRSLPKQEAIQRSKYYTMSYSKESIKPDVIEVIEQHNSM